MSRTMKTENERAEMRAAKRRAIGEARYKQLQGLRHIGIRKMKPAAEQQIEAVNEENQRKAAIKEGKEAYAAYMADLNHRKFGESLKNEWLDDGEHALKFAKKYTRFFWKNHEDSLKNKHKYSVDDCTQTTLLTFVKYCKKLDEIKACEAVDYAHLIVKKIAFNTIRDAVKAAELDTQSTDAAADAAGAGNGGAEKIGTNLMAELRDMAADADQSAIVRDFIRHLAVDDRTAKNGIKTLLMIDAGYKSREMRVSLQCDPAREKAKIQALYADYVAAL